MRLLAGFRLAIPTEAARARGFRFPANLATDSQKKSLANLFTDYLWRDMVNRHQGLPAKTLAVATGMGVRTANYMLKEARDGLSRPVGRLVVDVLHGMLSGELAGLLGYRKDTTNRAMFKIVYDCDVFDYDLQVRLQLDDENRVVGRAAGLEALDQFRVLHAAFRLDYADWSRAE